MSQQSFYSLARGPFGYRPADNCFRLVGRTQTMAAGLAANSVVFAMVCASTAPAPGMEYIERIRAQWTTLNAFGTPITPGRGLALAPGDNVLPTGGAIVLPCGKSGNAAGNSNFSAANNGLARIATTTALGGTTINIANGRLGEMQLTDRGAAGASLIYEWDFTGDDTAPLGVCDQGVNVGGLQSVVLYAPQAMDAGGTWELTVEVDTCRLPTGFIL